ncbi:MAG: hypothetical protein WBQ39_02250, partial [Terriglobales bacterium]
MTSVRSARLLGRLLLALAILAAPARSFAQGIGIAVTIAPPGLPVYTQPLCPGEGFLWTPGYWGWDADDDDYYWVPGTWVLAPEPGFLWTPGYWGWGDGGYLWHDGYWGENVGFYGGIDYGFGYGGSGFQGGYWQGGNFFYNTSVMNVNRTVVHNVYTKTVVNNMSASRVSYNGGRGGTSARPTAQQEQYARERHIAATSEQTSHQRAAASNRSLRASVNHGKPPVAATARPGNFTTGVVAARAGGKVSARPAPTRATAAHENAAKPGAASRPTTTEHANARPAESKPSATRHE